MVYHGVVSDGSGVGPGAASTVQSKAATQVPLLQGSVK